MLQEKGLPEPLAAKQYAFVGFNVLDKVESALFSLLGEQGRAWFYWDYDVFYTEQNQGFEAGTFLRSNLKLFPNQLPQEYFDNFRHTKQVEFLAASTENAQVHALAPWLEQNLSADEKETAVVLCNEALIEPVLHAIPPSVKEANITKGYPVRHTVAHQVLEKAWRRSPTVQNPMSAGWKKPWICCIKWRRSSDKEKRPLSAHSTQKLFSWSTLRSTVSAASSVKVGSTWNVQRSSDW